MSKQISPIDYFWLATWAFAGFGLEILLAMVMPQGAVYAHLLVTAALWLGVSALIVALSIGRYSFNPFACREKPSAGQLGLALALTAVGVASVCYVWGGFKPALELASRGMPEFLFQYLYYIAETCLITLSVVYGQKWADSLKGGLSAVPWGGVFLALTWGLIHVLTQGLATGLMAVVWSLLYGQIYLLCRRNLVYAFPLILLIFLL